MKNYKEIVILIAEDDDGHAELIKDGIKNSGVYNNIIRFSDGEEVLDFLSMSDIRNARKVDKDYLLLLDIKMPKIDGIEVLKKIKSDDELKDIPVIMLTTTDDPREVESCYKIGCNIYIVKPIDFLKFAETLKRLGLFIQIIKI
jgi:CheY-like chemotaxis protein